MKITVKINPAGKKVAAVRLEDKGSVARTYTLSAYIDDGGFIDVLGTIHAENGSLMYQEHRYTTDLTGLVEVARFLNQNWGEAIFDLEEQIAITKNL